MNLGQMRDHVYFLADEQPGQVFSTDRVNRAINIAIAHVARSVPQNTESETITLAASQRSYPLTNPVIEGKDSVVDSVTNADGLRLVFKDEYTINDPTLEGTPNYWYPDGAGVGLYPVPDANSADDEYTVVYRKEHDELISDGSSPNLSLVAQDVACIYAVYLLKMKDDEHGSADRWRDMYETRLREIAGPATGVWKAY